MQKIVHIVGPTGVGKTNLSIKLARKFNADLISADSIQIFKKLDIISGKDIPTNSKFELVKKISNKFDVGFYKFSNTKIYNLDIVNPDTPFTVFDFLEVTNRSIDLILEDKKNIIIVGGTGLYFKSFIEGIDKHKKPDFKKRQILLSLNVEILQEKIKKLDPERYNSFNNSDLNNPRRLIRAIEIAQSKSKKQKMNQNKPNFQNLVIGLYCDREILKERILTRVKDRLKLGALKEAESLFKNYEELTQQVKDANGYRQLFEFLQNKTGYEKAIEKWKISEFKHAKNQMTWFRKYGDVKWFEISKKDYINEIEQAISKLLS